MTTKYAFTETTDTLDASGAVTATEIKRYTVAWEDADAAVRRAGLVADRLAMDSAAGEVPLSANQQALAAMEADKLTGLGQQLVQLMSAASDAEIGKDAAMQASALAQALAPLLQPPLAAQYITAPGQYAKLANGSVLSMGPNGEVYQDGSRVMNAPVPPNPPTASTVSKLVVIGLTVWGVGRTNGLWYRRTPTTWVAESDLDAATLK